MKKLPIILLLCICSIFSSCDKKIGKEETKKEETTTPDKEDDKDDNKEQTESIISKMDVTFKYQTGNSWEEESATYGFTYDDQGRILTVSINEDIHTTLTYEDGLISTVANPGFYDLSISYKLDENNLVTTIMQDENEDIAIEYNDRYVIKAGSPQEITWNNGNIVETSYLWDATSGEILTFEYTDHEVKNINLSLNSLLIGEWESLAFFLDEYSEIHPIEMQGYFGESSKNYIESISRKVDSDDTDTYKIMKMTYTLADNGAPTQIIRNTYKKDIESGDETFKGSYTINIEYQE